MVLQPYEVEIRQVNEGDPRVMVIDVTVWGIDALDHFVSALARSGKDFSVKKGEDPFAKFKPLSAQQEEK